MRNKSGQFFGLWLVFITLFFCSFVIYDILVKDASNSMVSPKAVLEVRDGLELFEMREVSLIKDSLVEANRVEVFGTDDFGEEFRGTFIEYVLADEDMTEFIFNDLTLKGKGFEDEARLMNRNFFENGLYSESLTEFENGNLVFGREIIGKEMYLEAKDKYNINFPVDFSFEFSRKYLISFDDGEFEVEVR
ncbi:hypothetical protein KAI32_02915 [Candidatus Pacearchaeota archaeon]|nr:hypothetical protein [Candidatus Pacearchaeota archaeon]